MTEIPFDSTKKHIWKEYKTRRKFGYANLTPYWCAFCTRCGWGEVHYLNDYQNSKALFVPPEQREKFLTTLKKAQYNSELPECTCAGSAELDTMCYNLF